MNNPELKWWKQRIKNIGHFWESWYFVYMNGYPARKLTVIGVTGTDGKTTTTTLIYEILKAAGIHAAMISTINAKYLTEITNYKSQITNKSQNSKGQKLQEVEVDTGLHTTNPSARELQPLLKKMAAEGVTHLVLEVTAHGLDQHRVAGCNISIGVLTNITRDHLDDFVSMERYQKAKLMMFKQPALKYAVLNEDDSSYTKFKFQITNYKLHKDSNLQIINYKKAHLKEVSPALAGEYNQYNMAAAAAVTKILEIPQSTADKVFKEFRGVPGRREEIKEGQKFRVFVDFAHTPNGLEQILKSLRNSGTQLIVVFGCTGERDKGKRPMMGRIAVNLADKAIITSDDTRSESQDQIYSQIVSGIPANMMNKVIKENDRKKAIILAMAAARPGDTVLLAGKGHEKSINLGNKEFEWNDASVAREIINSMLK